MQIHTHTLLFSSPSTIKEGSLFSCPHLCFSSQTLFLNETHERGLSLNKRTINCTYCVLLVLGTKLNMRRKQDSAMSQHHSPVNKEMIKCNEDERQDDKIRERRNSLEIPITENE